MDKISLVADNLVTGYGKFKIANVTFTLESGDILGLVGRSGSGKSTVIETLIGIKKPVRGNLKAYVNDKETKLNELIGYSPQENSLYDFLTIEENLVTFGRLHKMRMPKIREMKKFLLDRLDLENSRYKLIKQLSGGMQKRADLAVSLIHSPKIIILDEPFNGLDVSLQRFIWILLKELAEEGRIIIISSHMLRDAQKNCKHMALIEKGNFYGENQVLKALKNSGEKSLESYLEKLFERDLLEDGGGK
jgi:ABC-type multidrug transport system ATPase subunit